jgi:hypothetical protein
MKQIVVNQTVKIPEGVTATAKSRKVCIRGPRGVLRRSFRHLSIDINVVDPQTIKVEKWFGSKKEIAAVRTICSHIENMVKGVTAVSMFIINNYKSMVSNFDILLGMYNMCVCVLEKRHGACI